MSPNLIELNTKIDSDDVTFSDAKSIIEHECSVNYHQIIQILN